MPITETMARNLSAALLEMQRQDDQRQELACALVSACQGRAWEVERYIYKALSMYKKLCEESNAQSG